jgi:ABC-type transport system involved in Fe-S cluster assembly fused permease/ATPase subunit
MWYPDAAFAVHQDMKSHTGAVLTMGKGAMQTISSKQKLNTRSTTEAELVAVDDVVVQAMWTRNFLEAQGYSSKTTIFQDNTSTILLETNGRESSSKRTRHINIRYFYITDCVQKNYINIKYCPTADMLGDFPSKPLQGSKFKRLRALMMNTKA